MWRGSEMQPGAVMFHSRGERLHQSTPGHYVWNLIAMDPAQLERYTRALSADAARPHGAVLDRAV